MQMTFVKCMLSRHTDQSLAYQRLSTWCYTPCRTPQWHGLLEQGGASSVGRRLLELGRWIVELSYLPKCQKCKTGDLVPLSDFGSQGAAIHYKAWACTNPGCGFNLKIRNGDLYVDEPISNGATHTPRMR